MNFGSKLIIKISILLPALLAIGCKELPNPFAGEKPLAKVDDKSLYITDIQSMFTPGITPEDSIKLLESYVDVWVKKQLKIKEAERVLTSSVEDIDRMVEEYRNSLLSMKIDDYYIEKTMDTVFTDKQISEYYSEHRSEFILDRTIIKGCIVKFPSNYRQKARLKELTRSRVGNEHQDLVDISNKNKFELTEFQSWTDLSDAVSKLPISANGNNNDFFKTGELQELKDGNSTYYFIISELKTSGDTAPMERVSDIIRRTLATGRRTETIHKYEEELYNTARSEKKIVINISTTKE